MKNIKNKIFKHKKSIASVVLASILTFSFNYTPISLIAKNIASAYKSSTTAGNTFYGNTSVSTESKIDDAKLPASLEKYFEGSSANFNIETYYREQYYKQFAEYADSFLRNAENLVTTESDKNYYNKEYINFLNHVGYKTLGEYYEAKKDSDLKNYNSVISYFEYFVTHEQTWTTVGGSEDNHKLPAIFTNKILDVFTQPFIYLALANYLIDIGEGVETGSIEGTDGLESVNDDVYAKSKQYLRIKNYIDKGISENIAIYSYDGTTQNNYVAGIIANGAPTSSKYYYEKNAYEEITLPNNVVYETQTFVVDDRTEYKNVIYYSTISKDTLNAELSGNSVYDKIKEFISNDNITADLERNPLLYRPLLPIEEGYLGSQYPIYVKYKSIPYSRLTSSSQYNLYIVDDDVTEEEQSTYDSLQYVNVITSEDLDKDLYVNPSTRDKLNPDRLYVQVPYNTSTGGDIYFQRLFGNISSSYLENLIKNILTDKDGNSRVYFKYNTKTEKVVYIDSSDAGSMTANQFKEKYPKYSYVVKDINKSETGYSKDDYYEIDANDFSSYLSAPGFDRAFPLYFKKIKLEYKNLDTNNAYKTETTGSGDFVYEMVSKPDVDFKTNETPAKTYETYDTVNNKLYVLSDANVEVNIKNVGNKTAEAITTEILKDAKNRGFFVKVPAHLAANITPSDGKTYEFYYKHEAQETRAIYVIDNKSGAANNEVYLNLHYNVITEAEYNNEYFNYVIVDSSDPNYNSNFKLYYKYKADLTPPSAGEVNQNYKDLFVQNSVTGSNAIYILDTNGVTPTEKVTYARLFYTPIDNTEFNNNSEFYVQLSEQELKQYGDNGRYTKLYYKYKPKDGSESRRVYIYSNKTDDTYANFYYTDSDYVASDYVLIGKDETGRELYNKKIRLDNPSYIPFDQQTYYYFQNKTANNIKLNANSYYVVSFYVYTNGLVDNNTAKPVSASLYITDTTGVLKEIAIDNISTNGTWKQYFAFIQTDTLTASTIQLSLYMGNKDGIAGTYQNTASSVDGVVLFDDIKVTLINETDFNKQTIDDKDVTTAPKEGETANFDSQDAFGNEIKIKSFPLKYVNNLVSSNWNNIFDFDNTEANFVDSTDNSSVQQKLIEDYFAKNPDALEYDLASFESDGKLWHYYISRDNSGQNKNEFNDYKDSYLNGKVNVSVIEESEIDKTVKDDDDKDDKDDNDKKPTDETDVLTVDSTFNRNNKVLKIENTDRLRSLGVMSAPFVIEQNQYYKITVWVYSPDKDATATIKAESIIGTEKTPTRGSLVSTSANVNANLKGYSTTPTNEYGWISISFYIEGNAYGNESVYLALLADKNQTIYFDNISIEKVTSSIYTTASSDSDNTTYCLSLSPSSMLISRGITNGYFNSVNVTDNYNDIDYTMPRTAKNWTLQKTNSSSVIAGVVPTSDEYIDNNKTSNFYYEYNGNNLPFNRSETRYANNLFGIYAPKEIISPIEGADQSGKKVAVTHNYAIYSSSTSLSSNKVFEISFDFFAGLDFNGTMIANLYAGSVNENRIISSFSIDSKDIDSGWQTYTFIVQTAVSSQSVYLEIGIEDASGTCFFQKAKSVQSDFASVEEARDNYVDLKSDMSKVKFINLRNLTGTIHGNEADENGNYTSNEYSTSLKNTSSYTVGQSGTVITNIYSKETKAEYWTIKYTDKITYYIKQVENSETGAKEYKLYSDSVFTKEVSKDADGFYRIDGKRCEFEESSSGKTLKLIVGNSKTPYDATAVNKTTYTYTFNEDAVIGDTIIPKESLENNISGNLFILANNKSTDYSSYSPVYTKTLSTSSYYVLKIYVKTSEIVSFNSNSESGLNINIKSISTSWNNISTVSNESDENNGFVCYQVLISTNKTSVSNFGVEFSLGTDKNPCSGYAIIAGVVLETFSSETLFNEYASTLSDDDKTVKRFYGETTSSNGDDDDDDDKQVSTWATFFYIFSSLLLGLVLVIALVAIIVKKHPIKHKKAKGTENIVLTDTPTIPTTPSTSSKKKSKKQNKEVDEEVETTEGDDGFV